MGRSCTAHGWEHVFSATQPPSFVLRFACLALRPQDAERRIGELEAGLKEARGALPRLDELQARLREVAEQLVKVSSKAEGRLMKLELAGARTSGISPGAAAAATGADGGPVRPGSARPASGGTSMLQRPVSATRTSAPAVAPGSKLDASSAAAAVAAADSAVGDGVGTDGAVGAEEGGGKLSASLGGMARVFAKRIEDLEARLLRVETEAGRGVRLALQQEVATLKEGLDEVRARLNAVQYANEPGAPVFGGSAPPPPPPLPGVGGGGGTATSNVAAAGLVAVKTDIAGLKADVQGLGQDVVALAQAIDAAEVRVRGEVAAAEERMDGKLGSKEEVLFKFARQIDLLTRKLREVLGHLGLPSGSTAPSAAGSARAAPSPRASETGAQAPPAAASAAGTPAATGGDAAAAGTAGYAPALPTVHE